MHRKRWLTLLIKRTILVEYAGQLREKSTFSRIRNTDCWQITANLNIVDHCPGIVNTGNDDQSVSRILLIRKLTTSRGTLFLLQCVTTLSQAWLSDKHFGILALRYTGLPENPTLEPFFTLNQKLKFAFYFKEQLSYVNLTIEFSLKPRHIYQHDWLL